MSSTRFHRLLVREQAGLRVEGVLLRDLVLSRSTDLHLGRLAAAL